MDEPLTKAQAIAGLKEAVADSRAAVRACKDDRYAAGQLTAYKAALALVQRLA